jgi:hypothetical protein
MENGQEPIYISEPWARSLWNRYLIYEDRIELKSWLLFKNLSIARDDLVAIEIFKPPVIRTKFWALKLDWAGLYDHVRIVRKTGWFKHLRFTPMNPERFVGIAKRLLQRGT